MLLRFQRKFKMKVLILAAGKGTRLKEKTADKPKCMVEVNGKPILWYQLSALKKNNIKDVVIVTGYKAEKIKEFIKTVKDMNIKLVNNSEYDTTNSSYSFWLARNEIKNDSYIHMNCDLIYHPDLLKKIIGSKYKNIIGINKNIKLNESMEQVVLQGDKIIKMELANIEGAVGRAVGIAKFSPENIKAMIEWIKLKIDSGDKNQHCYEIISRICGKVEYYGLDTKDMILADINTLEDLEKANKNLKDNMSLFL